MLTRDKIMTLLAKKDISSVDLSYMGYTVGEARGHLSSLFSEGRIFKYKKGNITFYTLTKPVKKPLKHPDRSRKGTGRLPDLPPLMLNWLGYTSIKPDPHAGEIVHGGQW